MAASLFRNPACLLFLSSRHNSRTIVQGRPSGCGLIAICSSRISLVAGRTGDPAMSGSMQDKRNDPRVPLIAAAEVTEVATGTRLSARTSDLSRTGCYIDTLNPTPVKTVVRCAWSTTAKSWKFLPASSMSAPAWEWVYASTKICLPRSSRFSIAGSPTRSNHVWERHIAKHRCQSSFLASPRRRGISFLLLPELKRHRSPGHLEQRADGTTCKTLSWQPLKFETIALQIAPSPG